MTELMCPSQSTDSRPVSERVVERIAAAEGVEPAELDARLYDTVDAEALDAFVDGVSSTLTVEFEFSDYVVTLDAADRVSVTVDPAE